MRLRNLTLAILLLCFSVQSWGAFTWTNSTNNILMADNAALSLPDANWTICIRVKQTTGVQAYDQRIIATSDAVTNDYYFMIYSAGEWGFEGYDGDGTSILPFTAGFPFVGNTSWSALCAVRSGSTVTIYRDGVSDANVTNASFNGVNSANSLTFGNRGGGTQDRALVGSAADFGVWTRALNAGELTAYAQGAAAISLPTPEVYFPMIRDYTEQRLNIAITNNSTTVGTHPRMYFPD